MAETLTLNRLPALTWNWLKMNAARLAPELSAAAFVPALENAGSLETIPAEGPWEMETGMGPDMGRLLADTPALCLALDERETMDAPAVLTYDAADGGAGSRLYLRAKAGSTMKIAVLLRGGADALAALQIKLRLDAGAKAELSIVQVLGPDVTCLCDIGAQCGEGARFTLTKLELGAGRLYAGAAADLIGRGSDFTAHIGYLGQDAQHLDMNYVARHRGKNTTCLLDSSGVLAGQAFKLFRGTIDLLPGGAGAKGQEEENVLLLDGDVVNQTIPLILCGEEDVEGNHGATIGRLDDKMLFYLASRGIPETAARRLLARARLDAVAALLPEPLAGQAHDFLEAHTDEL